ncbi:MAG: hypothetical protein ACKVT0_03895 [Planctomycetaceae bacterium]
MNRSITTVKKKRIPQIDFDEIVSHDPFQELGFLRSLASAKDLASAAEDAGAKSAESSGAENLADSESKSLEEIKVHLQSRKVSAILHGSPRNFAIIDARVVHVGDLLEPGLRIVDIKSTGVVLRIEPR